MLYVRSGSFATGSIRQQVKPCARCSESGSNSRALRLLAALDAQQNFEPFRLAEACNQCALGPGRRKPHVSIFTYSKSPGLLSMPTLGGEIQEANSPVSVTGVISEAMKSPSSDDGSHSPLRLFQVASSISTPSGVACTSLNSPIWRWKATLGSVSLKWKPAVEMILF